MPKILLIGMGPTALSAFESLLEKFSVIGVVRNDTDPYDPVISRAQQAGVTVYPDAAPTALADLVANLCPDCVVVSSYHRILPPRLIEQTRFVNVHYAPLPQYRGRANVNWAIINDEPSTAITIHTIVPGLDAGNILFQRLVPISERATVADLYEALNALQREHLADTVLRYLAGYPGTPQREEAATYGCTRIPADGEIDWCAATHTIDGLVRALVEPFPGAYTYYQGQRLIVWQAEPAPNPPHYAGRVPGRVVNRSKKGGYVDVLTGDSILRIAEVQIDGAERTSAAAVITSVRDTLGLRTSDLLARIHLLEQQVAMLAGKVE